MKNYLMTRNADNDFDTLFDDMFGDWGIRNSTYPTVNVYEDSKAFYVEAELPGYTSSLPEGINEDAIEAEFKNGILTITLPKLPVEQPKKISVKIAG